MASDTQWLMTQAHAKSRWAAYDRVAFHRYRVRFVAKERVHAPPERLPNMLRGAFEMAFRRLVCHDIELDCGGCPLSGVCPYPPIFRPSPPMGTDRLSKQSDLPRPFVFEPPLEAPHELVPGDALDVGLTLFGDVNEKLAYFVVALRELAARGLGSTRGKLLLDRVTLHAPDAECTVFTEDGNELTPQSHPWRCYDLAEPGDGQCQSIRIDFLTPTTLKRDGHVVEHPSFGDVFRRARDRLSTITAFFGDGPLKIDFAGLARSAEEISTRELSTRWARRTRRSSRSGLIHETSGFVGFAVYEGELAPFLPVLRSGELLHVGKYAVWGNGRIRVEVLS